MTKRRAGEPIAYWAELGGPYVVGGALDGQNEPVLQKKAKGCPRWGPCGLTELLGMEKAGDRLSGELDKNR
jgi:hypothetical protein